MRRIIAFLSRNYLYSFFISLSVWSLLAGGIIYILFRPSEHIFFSWIRNLGFDHSLDFLRSIKVPLIRHLPGWLVYSLPNGLWAFAYAVIITGIWAGSKSWLRYIWLASIPVLVIGYEVLQYTEIIQGTYSFQDITFGSAGLLLGIELGNKINKSKTHENAIE